MSTRRIPARGEKISAVRVGLNQRCAQVWMAKASAVASRLVTASAIQGARPWDANRLGPPERRRAQQRPGRDLRDGQHAQVALRREAAQATM